MLDLQGNTVIKERKKEERQREIRNTENLNEVGKKVYCHYYYIINFKTVFTRVKGRICISDKQL
jgi:hypothetical protein